MANCFTFQIHARRKFCILLFELLGQFLHVFGPRSSKFCGWAEKAFFWTLYFLEAEVIGGLEWQVAFSPKVFFFRLPARSPNFRFDARPLGPPARPPSGLKFRRLCHALTEEAAHCEMTVVPFIIPVNMRAKNSFCCF